MPLEVNTNTNKQNGTQPNQEKQKILQENKFFPTISKINPTLEILDSKAKSKDSNVKRC